MSPTPSPERPRKSLPSSTACRAASPKPRASTRQAEMARLVSPGGAKSLGLPGRNSEEIVSGAHGGSRSLTLRRVEIPVPLAGEPQRGRHCHDGHEECIYVLCGEGVTSAGNEENAIRPGDTILIPPGEMHVTRNIGTVPLVLLCFFPVAEIDMRLESDRV